MTGRATVHLIDASAYIFRAYYALRNGPNDPSGRPVNAVYGFTSFLLRYLDDESPTHAAVAFDESLVSSFRNELYPDYKANRESPPQELKDQFDDCRECARVLGFASYSDDRHEADDLIGTLAVKVASRGHRAVVVSPDKDLTQLVGDQVEVYDFAGGVRYGPREVRAKFGVNPGQITDYLGLVGDAVDNIPGVPGVGPKSATHLLGVWSDLEGLYKNIEKVPTLPVRGAASLAGRLEDHRESAFISRTLATLVCDIPLKSDMKTLQYRGASRPGVDELFGQLGFGRIRDRIGRWQR